MKNVRACLKILKGAAAGLLSVARVGSAVTARCGDAPTSPPWPRPKSLTAAPPRIFRQALKCSLFSLLCFITVINTQAHSVWIEDNPKGELIIRFAEPDGKFEKSPGHLDSLTHPVAWKMVSTATNTEPSAFEVEKKKDHFLLVKSAKSDSAQTETAFQVMVHPGKPGRRPNFYARWQPQGGCTAAPALMLDIVPTGKAGEARAYFRGKPLGNAKARLRTPDEKEQDVVADADGFFKFPTEQSGFYLLSIAHHREPLPGFAGGKAYELFSHNASLSWRQ